MSKLADWELLLACEDALTASVPAPTRALSGDPPASHFGCRLWKTWEHTPDHYYALVMEVKKGVPFHPVKLIRHSRAIGVSFCASNSAADEVTHVRVRSHSPGLYLPCVCLLMCPKPVQDSIQILPNSERVFPFGPGPESTDVQGHPLWTPHEPQRIRRQSLSPRDRIICWNCGPSATSGCGAHMQKESCRGAAGTTTVHTGLCHEGWPPDLQSCNSTTIDTQGLPALLVVLDFDMQDIILRVAAADISMEVEFGEILPPKSKMKNDSDQLSGMPSFHFC